MSAFVLSVGGRRARVLPLLCGAILLGGYSAMARDPVRLDSEEDKLIRESFLKHTTDSLARFTPEAVARIVQPEDICWTWSCLVDIQGCDASWDRSYGQCCNPGFKPYGPHCINKHLHAGQAGANRTEASSASTYYPNPSITKMGFQLPVTIGTMIPS